MVKILRFRRSRGFCLTSLLYGKSFLTKLHFSTLLLNENMIYDYLGDCLFWLSNCCYIVVWSRFCGVEVNIFRTVNLIGYKHSNISLSFLRIVKTYCFIFIDSVNRIKWFLLKTSPWPILWAGTYICQNYVCHKLLIFSSS